MKNFIFLFVFITISNLAYGSALPDDDYLPNQPHPSDPDYTQPKIPKKPNIPTNTPPANDPIYDPPKTKPKPGKLPNPGKLGGVIGSIVGDYIIGKVDEGLDWLLNPKNHEPKRHTDICFSGGMKGSKELIAGAYCRSNGYSSYYSISLIDDVSYKVYRASCSEYGVSTIIQCGPDLDPSIEPNITDSPTGPNATPPSPAPRPGVEPAPRPGTEPSTRPGVEPAPRPGTEPSTRPGVEPAPRPGTEPSTRPGVEPAPRPGTEPSTRPGVEPAPRPGTEPSTRPGVEPAPRPGTEPSTRPGVDGKDGVNGTNGKDGKDGKDGKSAGQGKPFELPKFCDWAKPVCDFIEWVKKEPKTSDDIVPSQNIELQDPASFDKKYINASKSCPPDVVKSFNTGFANNEIRFAMKPVCDFASDFIRPVVIFLAYIFAIINIGNAFKVG